MPLCPTENLSPPTSLLSNLEVNSDNYTYTYTNTYMLAGIYVLSEYVNTQIFMHAYILTDVFPPISRRGGHFPPLDNTFWRSFHVNIYLLNLLKSLIMH